MKSTNPRIETLKELIALEERRAAIQGELNSVEQRISALRDSIFTGSPVSATSPAVSSPKARPGRPPAGSKGGTYREIIMAALEAAGEAGVRVKELAAAMNTKPVNIHSWFHSNLKKIPSIKKITGGHYRIAGGAKAGASAAPAPKPAAASAPKAKAGKGRKGPKRGALSAAVLDALKAAGSSGIKVGDLADKLGANYKNLYVWFATTGKKNPNIKRIAPATYRLNS